MGTTLNVVAAVVVLIVALGLGYWIGRRNNASERTASGPADPHPADPATAAEVSGPTAAIEQAERAKAAAQAEAAERAETIARLERELADAQRELSTLAATAAGSAALAGERPALFADLAAARAEAARFRQIVIDLENDAPPPLLGSPGTPDDLKLIVGVGPVLERMLYQLGITTYRQIANWSEHDIDDVDSRLHEFPGRIRRDAWVTQARALHQSKYGTAPSPRDRG